MSDPAVNFALSKSARPVWYNLSPANLPLPGLVSIFHRISGLVLFVGLFWLLYLLDASLSSPASYAKIMATISHPLAKLVLLGFTWAFLHHFCAGIRFLLLDIHVGASLSAARRSSWIVFAISLLLTAILGARLW
jgi:succinate dehydrogenase / fumarate reductase, cytochrome b subunit